MGKMETQPRAPRVRLKQLAFALGLSQTTVSRALAGYADVSRETRARVFAAAQSAGYLEGGFVGMLLRIGGDVPVDGPFVAGLSSALMRAGRDLFIATVPPGGAELTVLRHLVDGRRVDAILVRDTADAACLRLLEERGFPFVTIAEDDDGETVASLLARRLNPAQAQAASP